MGRLTLPQMYCRGATREGRKPHSHTFNALLPLQAVRRHSMVRATTRADVRPTIICAKRFEVTKQKHNNATENVTILWGRSSSVHIGKIRSQRQETTYDHMSSAHGRLKTIAIGSRPVILPQF